MRGLDGISDSMDMSLSELQELVNSKAWCATVHGFTELDILSNLIELKIL